MKSTLFLTMGLAFSSVAFAQSASTMVDSAKDEMKSAVVENTDADRKPLLIKPKNQAQPKSVTKTNTDESMDGMKDDHDHEKHDHDHDHDKHDHKKHDHDHKKHDHDHDHDHDKHDHDKHDHDKEHKNDVLKKKHQ
ncbi:hypothetical protein [Taylorella asinigenitalis]|uniref:FimA protein n=1 Tax=Taylorella asinigenitalis (strain MCE3) TaxID=1008459 RepID=G4QCL0_TAYAM|nr:hypothetical protein [Taylorella asinigenitalis]AEP36140.1 FimA protein [Taylorella asinigenitalis MCE3]